MRLRPQHPVHRPHHRFAGRLVILLWVLLLLPGMGMTEENTVLQAFYNPAYPPPVVAAHEPAGNDYFADAVFIGDSMMEYVEMLGQLPGANFVWKIGMSAASTGRKQFRVKGSDTQYTVFERAAMYQPKKIYVLLGSNGLDGFAVRYIIADYEHLADELIAHFPEALIYVIAPPPMSYQRMTGDNGVPVGRYSGFCEELRALAERRNFYFIDLYHLLVGKDGYLPRKYDAGDGYHLSSKAYSLLIEQARKQAVPYPDTELP